MIGKDCDNWKGLWWLKTIVINEIYACNRMNFSSNVNEVIMAVLNSLFIFTERFCTHQKHQKHKKHKKYKDTQAKAQKRK